MPDDEELIAALGEALRARREVPEWFVDTGKNAYAWHNIDAELAQLTYDSLADSLGDSLGHSLGDSPGDRERAAAVRSEAASIRALTFTSAQLSIELEVGEGSLLGQIIPPRAGTLEVHTTAGVASSAVDEIGCFAVTPIPASPFRLRCRTEDGTDVLTGWITLLFRWGPLFRWVLGPADQVAPRATREAAVACWTGSSASPSRTL